MKALLEIGVQPDVLVLRTEHELNSDLRRKVALFCNVAPKAVIQSIDVSTIYEVPIKMREEKLDEIVLEQLGLPLNSEPDLESWKKFLYKLKNYSKEVRIGLVGKYVELHDAYKSIVEAFIHAGAVNDCKVNIEWIHSEELNEQNAADRLKNLHGILVAPGFGHRGISGKWLLSNMPGRTTFLSSVFVWGCRWLSSNLHVTYCIWKMPIRQKWLPKPSIR